MKSYTFTVPGDPVSKGRPRVSRVGAGVRIRTPKKTVHFEAKVAHAAEQAGVKPIDGPVAVTITAIFMWPKSLQRKRSPRGREWEDSGPDRGALVGAYYDDRQVANILAFKEFCPQGEPSRTEVTVAEMKNE